MRKRNAKKPPRCGAEVMLEQLLDAAGDFVERLTEVLDQPADQRRFRRAGFRLANVADDARAFLDSRS